MDYSEHQCLEVRWCALRQFMTGEQLLYRRDWVLDLSDMILGRGRLIGPPVREVSF